MIKILEDDYKGCSIEIKGNTELIAMQVVTLLDSLSQDYPYIFDRINYYMDKLTTEKKNQNKQ